MNSFSGCWRKGMQNSSLLHRWNGLGADQVCAHGGLRSGIFAVFKWSTVQSKSLLICQASITAVRIKLWAFMSVPDHSSVGMVGSGSVREGHRRHSLSGMQPCPSRQAALWFHVCTSRLGWGSDNGGENREFSYKPNVTAYVVQGSARGPVSQLHPLGQHSSVTKQAVGIFLPDCLPIHHSGWNLEEKEGSLLSCLEIS